MLIHYQRNKKVYSNMCSYEKGKKGLVWICDWSEIFNVNSSLVWVKSCNPYCYVKDRSLRKSMIISISTQLIFRVPIKCFYLISLVVKWSVWISMQNFHSIFKVIETC